MYWRNPYWKTSFFVQCTIKTNCQISDGWSRDMLYFEFLEKGLGLVSLLYFVYDLSRKDFPCFINWPRFIVLLPLLVEIFGNTFIITRFRQTWKTWKTQGISRYLREIRENLENSGNFVWGQLFWFSSNINWVSHAFSSLFDHLVVYFLIVGIVIFLMQLSLYLNDLWGYSHKEMTV